MVDCFRFLFFDQIATLTCFSGQRSFQHCWNQQLNKCQKVSVFARNFLVFISSVGRNISILWKFHQDSSQQHTWASKLMEVQWIKRLLKPQQLPTLVKSLYTNWSRHSEATSLRRELQIGEELEWIFILQDLSFEIYKQFEYNSVESAVQWSPVGSSSFCLVRALLSGESLALTGKQLIKFNFVSDSLISVRLSSKELELNKHLRRNRSVCWVRCRWRTR